LFVSHSMTAIASLCTRAILLRDGEVAQDGAVTDVVAEYLALTSEPIASEISVADMKHEGTGKGRFVSLTVTPLNRNGRVVTTATPGCDVALDAEIECLTDFSEANVAVVIGDRNGSRIIDVNSAIHGDFLSMKRGDIANVRFTMKDVLLKPGSYTINLWIARPGIESIDMVERAGVLTIHEDTTDVRHPETFPGLYQCRFTHSFEFKPRSLVVSR
jgi:homopolymeric O-antigen transport system ATP-binding protein